MKDDLINQLTYDIYQNKEISKSDVLNLLKRHQHLKEQVEKFIDKNYHPGAKADREDYGLMVSARDVWELRNALLEITKPVENNLAKKEKRLWDYLTKEEKGRITELENILKRAITFEEVEEIKSKIGLIMARIVYRKREEK